MKQLRVSTRVEFLLAPVSVESKSTGEVISGNLKTHKEERSSLQACNLLKRNCIRDHFEKSLLGQEGKEPFRKTKIVSIEIFNIHHTSFGSSKVPWKLIPWTLKRPKLTNCNFISGTNRNAMPWRHRGISLVCSTSSQLWRTWSPQKSLLNISY